MRSILSLGLTAAAAIAASASAETTVAVLEYGPGGSVRRTTSPESEPSTAAALTSLWSALHRPTSGSGGTAKRAGGGDASDRAGMSVAPDLFAKADSGIVIGIDSSGSGGDGKAFDASAVLPESKVVGRVRVAGGGSTAGSIVDSARAMGMETHTYDAGDVDGIARRLSSVEGDAARSGRTVVVHVVSSGDYADGRDGRRRLEDREGGEQEGQNGNANGNYAYGEKTMYEIQSFNLYLWTALGLFVVLSMVMGAFIGMPLYPDTLLFGESAKVGSD